MNTSTSTYAPSVHIETAGCAFNASDSEVMAGILERAGYRIVDRPDAADVLILNTCTVKDRTYYDFVKRLKDERVGRSRESDRTLIVSGCIPKANSRDPILRGLPTLGPDQIDKVDEVVAEALAGRAIRRIESAPLITRPELPTRRRNPVVEIFPVARGCLSACTFCQTRIARGRLASFRPSDLVERARRAIDEGIRIFWITGQDTAAYGYDIGTTLPQLASQIADLPGDFMIRLGMGSPRWIVEHLDGWLDLLEHPKLFKFLHVPVQSGSEKVVADMKRDGMVADFEKIVESARERFPRINIITDIIVGYPTETDEDFRSTLDLIRQQKLGFIHTSKFSPRPGTAASKLKQLPGKLVSERTREVMALSLKIAEANLGEFIDEEAEVLLEESGASGFQIGRTNEYHKVHVTTDAKHGSRIRTTIEATESRHLICRELGVVTMV